VERLLQQAEQADQQDQDPQQLPKEIARRQELLQKMDAACAKLEARAQARAKLEAAEYERQLAAREERNGGGPAPKPPRETPEPEEQINLTDADAHLMRKSSREGYTQSYNAQASVDADGSQLIVGQRVSTCVSDSHQLVPSLQSIPATLGTPTMALADCGYANRRVFEELSAQAGAPQLYVSVHREDAHAERRYDFRPPEKINQPRTITHPVLLAMAEKLKTKEGRALYRRRASTVEPVFGIIKHVLGFRQFLMRGLNHVAGEWNLVCLAYNLKRLHRLRQSSSA
jgi:hypothetical protein